MATRYDLPVRKGSKLYRLVSDGVTAGLFDRNGLAETLTVTLATKPNQVPKVAAQDGTEVKLTRASRPCSCVGMPWKNPHAELLGQLQ